MAQLLGAPYSYFSDANGAPLNGGKIYTYAAGTVTPQATYTDSTGITPLANPVILDSAGRAQIWLSGSYKIVVKDSLDNTISTTDNVTSSTATGDMSKAVYDAANIQEQLVGLTAVQTLTNKTLPNYVSNVKVQVKTASGTYTPSTGMREVLVILQAPGGGGGGSNNAALGGVPGGAGSTSISVLTAAQIGASQTVTLPAGGAAGSSGGTNGTTASAASVGVLMTANGGVGGTGNQGFTIPGALGGAAGTGDIAIPGQSSPGNWAAGMMGWGANSFFGAGAIGHNTGAGSAGLGYGSGGSGGVNAAGGAGAPSVAYFIEFCSQ